MTKQFMINIVTQVGITHRDVHTCLRTGLDRHFGKQGKNITAVVTLVENPVSPLQTTEEIKASNFTKSSGELVDGGDYYDAHGVPLYEGMRVLKLDTNEYGTITKKEDPNGRELCNNDCLGFVNDGEDSWHQDLMCFLQGFRTDIVNCIPTLVWLPPWVIDPANQADAVGHDGSKMQVPTSRR